MLTLPRDILPAVAKRIEQTLELWNILHEREVKAGRRKPQIVAAKVDNGSTSTVIPEALAEKLGLMPLDWVWVRNADERKSRRRRVQGLKIRVPGIPGREITTDALVEPKRTTVLLGCEELERMDLVAIHKTGVLAPRPGTEKGITAEVEEANPA